MKITLLTQASFGKDTDRSTMCCTVELPALPIIGDEIMLPGFVSPFIVIGKRHFYPGSGFITITVEGIHAPYQELEAKGWECYT